jgi:ATP-binding protein involved in chromosome partitioning
MLRSSGFLSRTLGSRDTAHPGLPLAAGQCHVPCMPMPTEIVGLLRSTIHITWEDGHETIYPARELRLRCRCASCIEEMTGRPLLDPASVPDAVRAKGIRLVGQYAIAVEWSDGHSTGIYNFRDLRAGCPCDACTGLRAAGKTPE